MVSTLNDIKLNIRVSNYNYKLKPKKIKLKQHIIVLYLSF
jgi:hypothetical protein